MKLKNILRFRDNEVLPAQVKIQSLTTVSTSRSVRLLVAIGPVNEVPEGKRSFVHRNERNHQ